MDLLPVWLLLAAPFVGSFLGVLVLRLPKREPVVLDVSRCDACGNALRPHELIPLASFLLQRGRCRRCGARIDPVHLIAEMGAIVVILWAATQTSGWVLVSSSLFGWVLFALALIDLRTGLLPDVLTLPLAAAGLAAAYLLSELHIADHIIGALAGFAAFAGVGVLYRILRGREGMGQGDAKLLGAIGAWVAWRGLPTVILFAALGGLLMAAMLHRGGQLTAQSRIAFGAPLALAGWLVWLYGPLTS
ncbi:MAG TPA: A24 family peptidase [Rhizomicrobium sp.]|jgi:leader peptidase (prepilin peptidase)/N-methyltransferase